jgi:putative heme iron utilization protein
VRVTGTSSADRVASAASLLDELGTLHLATVTPSGVPQASCAPYVTHGGAFYVYLSALASHVGNLRAGAGVGVLLVRDEARSPELFARQRLAVGCRVEEEPRGTALWNEVLDRFEGRFGETASRVRSLEDFALFRLVPEEGRVVAGFARAGALDADALRALLLARDAV